MKIIKLTGLFLVLGLSMLIVTNINGQTPKNLPSNIKPSQEYPEPSADFFESMCFDVGEPDLDDDNLERILGPLYAAAGIDRNKDSSLVKETKMNTFWQKYSSRMVCSRSDFSVVKGYILKLASKKNFMQFLKEAIALKMPLNKVDESDQRTTLDYIRDEITRNPNGPTTLTLRIHYDLLREAGAKHKSELK